GWRVERDVGLADELVVFQLAGGAREANAADLEEIGTVHHLEHLLDVLLDDEDREPFRANAADQIEHLLHDQRSETRGRLIHQEKLGPRHQPATDRTRLLLTARERAGGLASPLAQLRKKLINPRKLLGKMAARGGDEGADPQVVLDAEPWKQPPIFRNMGNSVLDDAVRGSADDRAPVERDGTGEGADEARYDPHQRGLASAMGADHAHGFACSNFERYAEQRAQRVVAGGNLDERQHDRSSARYR